MSKSSTNTSAVPEAKSALNRFKFEIANELGVPLTDGYNGNLTSKENGSVGWLYGQKNDRSPGKTDGRQRRLVKA